MGKHQNLMAYDGFELHDNILDVGAYKKNKLKEVQKNINFISKMFDDKIKVLETGSGNSKFLYVISPVSRSSIGSALSYAAVNASLYSSETFLYVSLLVLSTILIA